MAKRQSLEAYVARLIREFGLDAVRRCVQMAAELAKEPAAKKPAAAKPKALGTRLIKPAAESELVKAADSVT